jgi:hypothetical protein
VSAQPALFPLGTTTTGPTAPTTTEPAPATTSSTTAPATRAVDTTMAPDTTTTAVAAAAPDTVAPSAAGPPTTAARPAAAPLVAAPASSLRAGSVSVAYGLGFATLLAIPLGLTVLTTAARRAAPTGGSLMSLRRNRLVAGAACLALAAIVGLVGYLKLSLEPDINRQIPYLASAGMALVILTVLGGALIVGEQMRTDQERIEQLEAAVESLASIVSPTVEAPARTRAASSRSK